MRKFPLFATLAITLLALSGCAGPSAPADDRPQVVASTNVYGDIAAQVGGDRIAVTSIIADIAKDPHSYEATAQDRLAVSRADLVIENGGGYDAFMDTLGEGSTAPVITAVDFAPHAGDNEHVWFDPEAMAAVAGQIAADLAEIDPTHAADYRAGADAFVAQMGALSVEIAALRESREGEAVLITEPLPGLLAEAVGLTDATPEGFAAAVEEGDDIPPLVLRDALALVQQNRVVGVLTTVQTGGSQVDSVLDTARQAGIPVDEFSELLAPEQSYAQWMRAAIDSLDEARSQ